MIDFQICGSCHTMVSASDRDTVCPRCSEALHPSAEARLRKFADNGTDLTKKGVRLNQAQVAASETLNKLAQYQRFIEWLATIDTSYSTGTGCSEFLESLRERARNLADGLNA